MPVHSPLISTIVLAIVLAFALGALAHRIRVSPLVGYLLAGVVLGPFTPGFVADQALAQDLADIGIILLMFGVGLHFSLDELLSVRAIIVPGVMVQIAVATVLGMGLAWLMGWSMGAGLVFGLALSVASTVVVLRALQERRLVDTERGRIAVGWLIIEDLVVVFALVLIPALAMNGNAGISLSAIAVPVALTLAKVLGFVAIMLLVGKRIIPWILHYVAHTGSRELFRLSVLAIALGFAYAASALFGVSFALGAFLAGMMLSESQLSQRAANESLPLRDAFAVLFFVSVGMLFDPTIVARHPLPLLATLVIITVVKAAIGYGVVRLFGYPQPAAQMIAATRAQIGEFSFILAGLGVSLAVLPAEGRDLILAGAILSILVNPLAFALVDRFAQKREETDAASAAPEPTSATPAREPIPRSTLTGHVVLVGYGRVGGFIGSALLEAKTPFLVIESERDFIAGLRAKGIETIDGNAADPEVVNAANLGAARCLMVAIPDGFEGGQVVEQARAINPHLRILARSHSEEETNHLMRHGASVVVMGEHEIAKAMLADLGGAPAMFSDPGPAAEKPATGPTGAATGEPPPPS